MAVRDLAHRGLLVEPASAVALAAFRSLMGADTLNRTRHRFSAYGRRSEMAAGDAQLFPAKPLSGLRALNEVLVATRAKAPANAIGEEER